MFPWDQYFMSMAEADWKDGRADARSSKSFFIRKTPFQGSYCLLGGVNEAINDIQNLDFSTEEFQEGAIRQGSSREFVQWLGKRKYLRVRINGGYEGTVFFPHEPIVSADGPLPDIRLVEGILDRALNYASLSLTKWFRLVRAARPGYVYDASWRRSQDDRRTSLNAMLAGCYATSNSDLAGFFDVPVVGTMGHEYPMSYGDVRISFRKWLEHMPHKPMLLVDTLQCLEHDFPIALDMFYEFREKIKAADPKIWGWRNDSGDLGYNTVEQYRKFMNHKLSQDPWFRERMRVVLANNIDEYVITNIINQIRDDAEPAGLDVYDIKSRILWMAGTRPGTCEDQSSLGLVGKLMMCDNEPTLKLALDADGNPGSKTSIPGNNFSCLVPGKDGTIACALIYPDDRYYLTQFSDYPGWRLCDAETDDPLEKIIAVHKDSRSSFMELENQGLVRQQYRLYNSIDEPEDAQIEWKDDTIQDVTSRINKGIDRLHFTSTSRLVKPHAMKVSVTPDLFELRDKMIKNRILKGVPTHEQ
jgi:nicotinate phosphoribosyltransferase